MRIPHQYKSLPLHDQGAIAFQLFMWEECVLFISTTIIWFIMIIHTQTTIFYLYLLTTHFHEKKKIMNYINKMAHINIISIYTVCAMIANLFKIFYHLYIHQIK